MLLLLVFLYLLLLLLLPGLLLLPLFAALAPLVLPEEFLVDRLDPLAISWVYACLGAWRATRPATPGCRDRYPDRRPPKTRNIAVALVAQPVRPNELDQAFGPCVPSCSSMYRRPQRSAQKKPTNPACGRVKGRDGTQQWHSASTPRDRVPTT